MGVSRPSHRQEVSPIPPVHGASLSRRLPFHQAGSSVPPRSQAGPPAALRHRVSSSACYRPSGGVSGDPMPSGGLLGLLPSSGGVPGTLASRGSSVGPRGRTKAPMAVAWPERSSWSWRRPRRYRYSMRRTSERGRQACCRNSARTRASAPGFPRAARSSSRYRLRTCLCSRLGRLMAAAGPGSRAEEAAPTVAPWRWARWGSEAASTSAPRAPTALPPASLLPRPRAPLAVAAVTSQGWA
uniref:Uncharacterized protein n=1 Tax=Equus asinus TaxID=9793 RepID=A0A9L0KDV6_EQUAS